MVQDLHFDAAMKRNAAGRDVICPHEDPGIPAGDHMPPFQFQNEILIHAVGTQFADGLSGTDEHFVCHCPRLRRRVHKNPAGEILAVEEWPGLRVRTLVSHGSRGQHTSRGNRDATERNNQSENHHRKPH